jgi:Nuclease-related domain
MEIKLLKRSGVPQAEREAHRQIQEAFHSTPFSKDWRGYAAFAQARPGRGTGDDDFDLVLVTHSTIIIIELKNWNGNLLQSDGHMWYLDGEDRGNSPVPIVNLKAKKLASLMTQKLGREKTPFINSSVVMHGEIENMELRPEEERSVLIMQQLLSFRYADFYRTYFNHHSRFNPLDHLKDYDGFFEGPS